MIEEWRPIAGKEGKYEVSNLGRVRSVPCIIVKSNGVPMRVKGRIRKLKLDEHGYPRISFNGKDPGRQVHQFVMETFVGPRPSGMEVRHADGDSGNAALSNLSYSTHAINLRDMWKHGTAPIGEKCVTHKLKEWEVLEILAIGKTKSLSTVAAEYGISFQHVSDILNRKCWKHLHPPGAA